MKNYLLGYDLGSSSIKASLLDADTGKLSASASFPSNEMEIISQQKGWAEQDPNLWWQNIIAATRSVMQQSGAASTSIQAIGIAYQMHGLVIVDKNQHILRPSIIWCDSRAVQIGEEAFRQLGERYCREHLLNSPGNFTASKLKWVKENEPQIFERIHKCMLPGDYLAMRLTGEIATTIPGLSEGIMWDYEKQSLPERLLTYYGISPELVPTRVSTFSIQGKLTSDAAVDLGLKPGIPLCYRAGDQPNNAFSLNVLHPGEMAATAGTSGVIYATVDVPTADPLSRVNTFVHVNNTTEANRYGVLLCVNGTGIMNSWLRKTLQHSNGSLDYGELNRLASSAPIGSEKLCVLPFGNGAERMLENTDLGGSFHGLNFNRHQIAHVCRAIQEGIVFALGYGFEIIGQLGIPSKVIRAGQANMFQSQVFCEAFANVTGAELQLFNTDGSQGAARGAGIGIKYYASTSEAFGNLKCIGSIQPQETISREYREAYAHWKNILTDQLEKRKKVI